MIEGCESANAEWVGLPFVYVAKATGAEGASVNFWTVAAAGDWATDCATGRGYAAALIAYLQESGNAPIMPSVIAAMPRELTGIEIGFLTMVGVAAASPAAAGCDDPLEDADVIYLVPVNDPMDDDEWS
jgi:hypothetical protein